MLYIVTEISWTEKISTQIVRLVACGTDDEDEREYVLMAGAEEVLLLKRNRADQYSDGRVAVG